MQLPAWPIPEFLAQVERFPQFLATGCSAAGGESKGHRCSTDVPPWFRGKPVLFLKELALFFRNSSNSSIYIYIYIGFFRYEIANVWWHRTVNIIYIYIYYIYIYVNMSHQWWNHKDAMGSLWNSELTPSEVLALRAGTIKAKATRKAPRNAPRSGEKMMADEITEITPATSATSCLVNCHN